METICRLVRVLQCPHECGHALLISQGSPGISTNLAQLAAHLCGYLVFRINSSALSAADRYTLDSFKADLVSAYTRAGVKVRILVILLIVFWMAPRALQGSCATTPPPQNPNTVSKSIRKGSPRKCYLVALVLTPDYSCILSKLCMAAKEKNVYSKILLGVLPSLSFLFLTINVVKIYIRMVTDTILLWLAPMDCYLLL